VRVSVATTQAMFRNETTLAPPRPAGEPGWVRQGCVRCGAHVLVLQGLATTGGQCSVCAGFVLRDERER
jgi:hypothetical protein